MDGNRHYSNPSVTRKSDQIRKLKKMNKMPTFDQSFLGYLLEAIFDDGILKNIPIGANAPHLALDANKLKFIEGKCIQKKRSADSS